MDVITSAWNVFSNNCSDESLKTLSNSSVGQEEISKFREDLIGFICVLKNVVEEIDKLLNSRMETVEVDNLSATANNGQSTNTCNGTPSEISNPQVEVLPPVGQDKAREITAAQPEVDPKLVQIKASKAEIERRISAFIERKQLEINEMNKREFCPVFSVTSDSQSEESCARTDAVFIPRAGSRSHVKVSRVVNTHGPQTVPDHHSNILCPSQSVTVKSEPPDQSLAVEERMQNIEKHLGLQIECNPSRDVVPRLKCLEKRILYLESLSPEYFNLQHQSSFHKKRRVENSTHMSLKAREITPQYENLSLNQIDDKIQILKDKLLSSA